MLSMGQAAKMAGVSKPTISRAIRSGKLSAGRTERGGYAIDPAELARVFDLRPDACDPEPVTAGGNVKPSVPSYVPPALPDEAAVLRDRVADLQAQLDAMARTMRERLADAHGERDDAREQRDAWQRQAEASQRLLTDARSRRGLMARLLGRAA